MSQRAAGVGAIWADPSVTSELNRLELAGWCEGSMLVRGGPALGRTILACSRSPQAFSPGSLIRQDPVSSAGAIRSSTTYTCTNRRHTTNFHAQLGTLCPRR